MVRKRRQTPPSDLPAQVDEVSVLPMEVRVGDRITDEQGEWEVDTRPAYSARISRVPR